MAKAKRRKQPDSAVPVASEAAPIRLLAVAVRELVYRELRPEGAMTIGDVVARGGLQEQTLQLSGAVRFAPPNFVEVLLDAKLEPVGEVKPFELSVRLSGMFQRHPAISNRRAAEMLNDIAARMLFPFIREALMTMTSKTIYGTIAIQPVTLGPLFKPEAIASIKN